MEYSVLEKHFDFIAESAKIGYAKPDARAFEYVANQLGVRLDECVFVDDNERYVEGARHVGMQGILFKDTSSLKTQLAKILED